MPFVMYSGLGAGRDLGVEGCSVTPVSLRKWAGFGSVLLVLLGDLLFLILILLLLLIYILSILFTFIRTRVFVEF